MFISAKKLEGSKLKAPKDEYRLPKSLSIEELEMLRESCDTVRQRAFLEILYATGCRLSEVHGLDKADINLQNMSTVVIGKGDKQREVYFSIRAMYHLGKYIKGRNDNYEALMVTDLAAGLRYHSKYRHKGYHQAVAVRLRLPVNSLHLFSLIPLRASLLKD
ncbi:hypothetical protein BTR25_07910 [Bacillus sp. MRMR6]|nr:hypothetical protein BTR25_07910 [Bacillus sp. MRMR6]